MALSIFDDIQRLAAKTASESKNRPAIARAVLTAIAVSDGSTAEIRRGREDRVVFGPASDRSGMCPASTDDEINR